LSFKKVFELLKETFSEWSKDNAPRLAAALAYYTVFSLPPLLLIVIAIAGLAFGAQAVQGQIVNQIQGLVGQTGAEAIQTMIAGAAIQGPGTGIIATILGLGALLFGATGVFGQLQGSLNTVWEVTPRPNRGIWGFIQDRFLSFSMVLGVGFLLLVSLVISAALSAIGEGLKNLFPQFMALVQVFNFLFSFGLITLLFAMMYKFLPDAKIAWKDVWIGAAITALLFTVGRFLLGLYLGNSNVISTYGAAGSLVLILLWIYYSAQILLLGAEFTQVYARRYGSYITEENKPAPAPQPVTATAEPTPAPNLRPGPAHPKRPGNLESSPEYIIGMLGFILGAILGAIFGTRERKS